MGVRFIYAGRDYEATDDLSAAELQGTVESAIALVQLGLAQGKEFFDATGEQKDEWVVDPWVNIPVQDGWLAIWVGSPVLDFAVHLTPDDVADWGSSRPLGRPGANVRVPPENGRDDATDAP